MLNNSYYCQNKQSGGNHSLGFSHSNQWERAELSVEILCPQVRPVGFYFPVLGPRERQSGAIHRHKQYSEIESPDGDWKLLEAQVSRQVSHVGSFGRGV